MKQIELIEIINNGENSGVEFKKDNICPEQLAKEMEVLINKKRIAVVSFPQGISKNYVLRNNGAQEFYSRVGGTSQKATRDQQARLFEVGGLFYTDMLPVPGTHFASLDLARINNYLIDILQNPNIPTTKEQWESRLEALQLQFFNNRMTMSIQKIYFILLVWTSLIPLLAHANADLKIEPDFIKANINQKKFDRIPENTIIFRKALAGDPAYFSKGEFRGYGWDEAFSNAIINKIREDGTIVYVDYLTPAKGVQYMRRPEYKFCGESKRSFSFYKNLKKRLKENNEMKLGYFEQVSIPLFIFSPIERIMVLEENVHKFTKHLYADSTIYNLKSILDDPDLYTAQVTNSGSVIKEYIYKDPEMGKEGGILKKYKRRIYDFVASDGEQLTYMISLKRMHWVGPGDTGDYHYLKNIKKLPKIAFLPVSKIAPNLITNDDVSMYFIKCSNNNIKELKKTMNTINATLKTIRTNEYFYEKIMQVFHEKTKLYDKNPRNFYFFKHQLQNKELIDSGYYDEEK